MKYAYDSMPVTDKQVEDVKAVRLAFSELSEKLDILVLNGRYRAIVETELETAQMFAVKGITHQAGGYDKAA
jgi:hypothetical protein